MWYDFLLPQPKPFNCGYLPERDGHSIYYLQYGNPHGIPVLSFHGGPGGTSRPKYAKLFDKNKYHFIQFDQRGCGLSKYKDLLHKNTTQATLDDALHVLAHLHINTPIIVHGASWGSTLALLFAEFKPQMVQKIVVSSVYLARPEDTAWVSRDSERFYPDLWEEMRAKINYKPQFFSSYYNLLFSSEPHNQLKALTYRGSYEYLLGQLNPKFKPINEVNQNELSSARLSFYYEKNKYFIAPNQIIADAKKIRDIPALMVHNRLDFCCPVKQAWDLHKSLPLSKLTILPGMGHSSSRILHELRRQLKNF